MRNSSGTCPKNFGRSVEKFLRDVHPAKTAANVSADTGCSVAQVEKWLEGASAPNGSAFARLTCAYGPAFLSAVLPDAPGWLNVAVRAERQAALEKRMADDQAELNRLLSAR